MTTTAGRGGRFGSKSGQRVEGACSALSCPGCCTAQKKLVLSGVKKGPQISAPIGARRKRLVSARCEPLTSVAHTPSATPLSSAPSVAIHRFPKPSKAQLSGHDSQPL